MARPSQQALDQLDLLGLDSILFNSEEGDQHAEDGRLNGLGVADPLTPPEAQGLDMADDAPEGTPADPGGPPSVTAGPSDIIAIDTLYSGRGGTRGPNQPDDETDSGGTPVVTVSYTSGTADTATTDYYNIQIDFYDSLWIGEYEGVTYDLGEAFIAVADYLSSIIAEGANDVYDMLGNLAYDDLVIEAYLIDIDGEGGVLGRAGPTGVRNSDGLTATGLMEFDIADALYFASIGLWDDIVFHETMHVLGIGTLWDYNNLTDTTSVLLDDNGTRKPTDDTYETTINYTGTEATAANGGVTLIVEEDGGGGTAGGHWDELQILANGDEDYTGGYDDEIMTGFIDSQNYLSAFSIAALVDLGYTLTSTDYADLADPYSTDVAFTSTTGYDELLTA
jgi:hypothetical protein